MSALNLYKTDFYAWTQEQAMLLRSGEWSHIDLPNLIEEIESLGKQQRQELRNRLSVLLGHLLKWDYQPQQRSQSWLATLTRTASGHLTAITGQSKPTTAS